jgi:hypothetical protein
MARLVSYYSKRPEYSRLYITEYSEIKYDSVDCPSIQPDEIFGFEDLPIVMHYETPDAYTSFQAKDGYYSAELNISDVGAIYLTTSDGSTVAVPNSGQVQINIQAQTFIWDTKIKPADFSPIEQLEFDRLYGQSDGSSNVGNIFEWIKPTSQTLWMGLCGEELAYVPHQERVNFTNLNSIALLTTPEKVGDNAALLFRLGNVTSLSIYDKVYPYPPDEEIEIRVIMNDFLGARGFNLFASGLNDPDVAFSNGFTQLEPGFLSRLSDRNAANTPDELLDMSGNAPIITVISPVGWSEQRFIKTDLPEDTDELTVSAQVGNVGLSQEKTSIPLRITGERLSAKANGDEQFRSRWEALPLELQSAYIAGAFAIALGIIGNIISNWLTFASFFAWLFSIPRYRQPVNLPANAHIFQLINGKKISGIMKPIEGRSTYRVFVLTEVREWDKDNWSEVLPTEVRVPQNQIERYYKAHP